MAFGEDSAQLPGFEVGDTAGEDHETPWGVVQQLAAVLLRDTR